MDSSSVTRDFEPTANWQRLRLRAELLARTRAFFARHAFTEVETPLLSADTVVDRFLEPVGVDLQAGSGGPRRMWLQTSPEFGMKRLMAAGGTAIYQITRAFRAGESGPLHNPEFTIVEWYRRGDSMQAGMELLSRLSESLLGLGSAERVSYAEAFRAHVGIDPLTAEVAQLADIARRRGLNPSESFATADRDQWLNLLLAELVEPHLGKSRPTILYHYPASQAALAQVCGSPAVAERFELYVRGVELANGYHELNDPNVLRERSRAANAQRAAEGHAVLPEESRLLAAMEYGLPDCTGVALGFDRVAMLAAGAENLAEVLAFPITRA